MQLKSLRTLGRRFSKKRGFAEQYRQSLDNPDLLNQANTRRNRSPNSAKFEQVENPTVFDSNSPTAEYMAVDSHTRSEELRPITGLRVTPSRITSALEDFLAGSNKAEGVQRSERLLESIRRGDFRLFAETSDAEIQDFHHRFDIYRENFIAQESNNRMKVTEMAEDDRRLVNRRDLGMLMRFEEKVADRYGISSEDHRLETKTVTPDLRRKVAFAQRTSQEFIDTPPSQGEEDEEEEGSFPHDPTYRGMGFDEKDQVTRRRMSVTDRMDEVDQKLKTLEFLWEEDDDIFGEVVTAEQLSLKARLGIYQCYLEGWSVREISVRYGIVPNRVKATVWQVQNFVEEILPDMGVDDLVNLLMAETIPKTDYQYVDYGMDSEALAQEQQGELSRVYGRNMMGPTMRANWQLKYTQEEILEGLKPIVNKKEDFITESFRHVGQNKVPYAIKNWVIHRGKGSLRVNRMFRRILERSHRPDLLPGTVQKKLKFGPRRASFGDYMR